MNLLLREHLSEKPVFIQQPSSRALKGQLISVKIARERPAKRNSSSTIDGGHELAKWLISEDIVNAAKFTSMNMDAIYTPEKLKGAQM